MTLKSNRPLLISIVGPTAVGKTALSISLAKHFDTEIISADSRQMYREIPIGTACPSIAEQAGIPHHFLAHLKLEEQCSAGQFEREAIQLIETKLKHKPAIVLCGGSGLYVKALLNGLDDVPHDAAIRTKLNRRLVDEGLSVLMRELSELDPICAARIDAKNPQRVIRALEVCLASGKPFSSFLRSSPRERPFDSLLIGLRMHRELLRTRISARCKEMLSNGWLEEAARVQAFRSLNSLNTIGYQSVFDHLDGKIDIETCHEAIVLETMQFAKRQMTWFKKMKDIQWIDLPHEDLLNEVLSLR